MPSKKIQCLCIFPSVNKRTSVLVSNARELVGMKAIQNAYIIETRRFLHGKEAIFQLHSKG